MIFLLLSSGQKAFVTILLSLFCIYSIYCDNKYYVKSLVSPLQGTIWPGNVFARHKSRCALFIVCSVSGSCSGSGLWLLAVMLFLQHVVINTLLFLQHKAQKCCDYWLLRVLNKFWTCAKRSHNKAFESFEHSFLHSFEHLVFNTR